MIHVGVELPAVDVISKNTPIHSVELIDVNLKSDGLIVHVFPPNENSTVTEVEQAVYAGWSSKMRRDDGTGRTVLVVSRP